MDEQYYVRFKSKRGKERSYSFVTLTEAIAEMELIYKNYLRAYERDEVTDEMDYIKITWGSSELRVYEFE